MRAKVCHCSFKRSEHGVIVGDVCVKAARILLRERKRPLKLLLGGVALGRSIVRTALIQLVQRLIFRKAF